MLWILPFDWQMDGKCSTHIGFAAHFDISAMSYDDIPAHRQSQSGTGTDIVGGEERVEDARHNLRRDAASGIGEQDDDPVFFDMAQDAYLAAFAHCLRRIEQQVEKYLTQMP